MTEEGLTLDHVSITIDGRALLEITQQVLPGEVLTVMGPSGSGKSALLAFIGGFLDPAFRAKGRVFVSGTELTGLPAEERHAGILFQDPLLFPHMSVAGNLAFALPEIVHGHAARRVTGRIRGRELLHFRNVFCRYKCNCIVVVEFCYNPNDLGG
ncbi:MAG: ATP-binding cassette domain-containing protein [Rhizobiales bacterium]|nr:ATP-binding cassette domain-containing protein [Hyphomicrobiales bacterium]